MTKSLRAKCLHGTTTTAFEFMPQNLCQISDTPQAQVCCCKDRDIEHNGIQWYNVDCTVLPQLVPKFSSGPHTGFSFKKKKKKSLKWKEHQMEIPAWQTSHHRLWPAMITTNTANKRLWSIYCFSCIFTCIAYRHFRFLSLTYLHCAYKGTWAGGKLCYLSGWRWKEIRDSPATNKLR